jgi:hypothetical protein
MDWEPRPMDEGLRSIIEESKGRKLLVINNLFPGYRAAEKNSQSMQLYLLETASIQLALPDPEERISPREYIEIFDELFSFFCENLSKAKENIAKRKR